MLFKLAMRQISKSRSKYIAILAIVALGVGFFAGLRSTKPSIMKTGDQYLHEHNLYDFELISTIGFDPSAPEELKKNPDIADAEGSVTVDAITGAGKEEKVIRIGSLPKKINTVCLKKGRLPENPNECVIDNHLDEAGKLIGKTISVSDKNDTQTLSFLSQKEFKIVGTCTSPLYLNLERGTTSVGDGTVSGFMYIPKESFKTDYYTEIYTKAKGNYMLYSKEYSKMISQVKPKVEKEAKLLNEERLQSLQMEMLLFAAAAGPAALPMFDLPEEPSAFVLTRKENIGYMCFDNDTEIINTVSTVFPLFFILVVALVSITTMTRIIEEQRGCIGTLKSLGYSNRNILSLYNIYGSSAALIGSISGFFIGSLVIPKLIWYSYTSVYDFSTSTKTVINPSLGILSITISLILSLVTTVLAARNCLREVPAELIRPKEGKKGKKILLEKIKPLWKRIGLLYRISLRNTFRYKKRLFMMILGISGCTALLVTGFGIQDSMENISENQYEKIFKYDYEIHFQNGLSESGREKFKETAKETADAKKIKFLNQSSVDIIKGNIKKSPVLIITDPEDFSSFVSLKNDKKKIPFPEKGGIVITERYADDLNIKKGDTLTLRTCDFKELELTVSGICENYIDNYAYMSTDTWKEKTGENSEMSSAFVISKDKSKKEIKTKAKDLKNETNAIAITFSDDFKDRIDTMLSSLSTVILLIVFAAGLLAFIVIYNLTNINLTERLREIATIKVLGFYPMETGAYIFRENLFLTGISAIIGAFMGKFLHRFVISEIKVDMVVFDTYINWSSYLISIALTFLFGAMVMFIMFFKLKNISMTESLKSVE